jgi:WD40 repeat protein
MFAALVLVVVVLVFAPSAAAAPGTLFFTVGSPEPHIAQLWSVKENGNRPRLLRRQMPVDPEGGTAVLARDGERIFCICRDGQVDSVRRDGSHLRRLASLPRGTRYDIVTLSPTGSAFWVKGYKWIVGQKLGGKARTIASFSGGAVIDERVVPSPDGRRLAVVAYGCLVPGCPTEETESVLTMRLDGTDRTLVYQGSGLGKEIDDVAWSADGGRLILSDGTGGESDPKGELPVHYPRQWFVVPSDGANPAGTVLPLSEQIYYPFFSPDGERLVSTAPAAGGPRLTIAGLNGESPRQLPGIGCRSYCEFAPRVFAWTRG